MGDATTDNQAIIKNVGAFDVSEPVGPKIYYL